MFFDLSITRKDIREPNGESRTLLEDTRLSIPKPGTLTAVMGRSGSGKSTLLRILAGLDLSFRGSILFQGTALARTDQAMAAFRRQYLGIIAQDYALLPQRTVLENVRLGHPQRASGPAATALKQVGLMGYERRRAGRLSGGEAQRVALARALVKRPAILLADEPTGALDAVTEAFVLQVLRRASDTGTALVLATHSREVAASCDRVLSIVDRRIR